MMHFRLTHSPFMTLIHVIVTVATVLQCVNGVALVHKCSNVHSQLNDTINNLTLKSMKVDNLE